MDDPVLVKDAGFAHLFFTDNEIHKDSPPEIQAEDRVDREPNDATTSDSMNPLHAEAIRRLELADRAQQVYFLAYQLECDITDMKLYTEALIIPQSWRQAIRLHLVALLPQLKGHLSKLIAAESILCPPFDRTTLKLYENELQVTEEMAVFVHDTIEECKSRAIQGERIVAAAMIQSHVRLRLREKGFYTTKVKLSHQQRGLIPGLFDGIKGETTMRISQDNVTLEYPKQLNRGSRGDHEPR